MPYELLIAIRHLKTGGLQTALIIAGATLGVSLFISVSTLINGLQAQIINRVTGSIPHIVVESEKRETKTLSELNLSADEDIFYVTDAQKFLQRKKKISTWDELQKNLLSVDEKITAISPKAAGECFIIKGEENINIILEGVIPELEDNIIDVSGHLIEGEFVSLSGNQIVIGKKLAEELGVGLRDKVRVSSAQGVLKTFIISGIYFYNQARIDRGIGFASMESSQELFKLDKSITSFDIRVKDIFQADMVAKKIESSYPEISAESWMETNGGVMQALRAQSSSSAVIKYFTMAIVALGIASVLIVSVIEKSRDIGILKAMGANNSSVIKIFLIEGLVVGFIGAVLGATLGLSLVFIMTQFSTVVEYEGGTFRTFPTLLKISDVIISMFVSIFIGLLGAVFPSLRAANLDPVKVIRYG